MSSEVASYFARLRAHLGLADGVESDLMRELSAHIEDRVAELQRRGVSEPEAHRIAISGFGRPQTFAHRLRQASLVTPWSEALLGAAAFALVALLVGPGLWRQPIAATAAGALIIAVAVYGLWLGRPAWFYPWAGVALTIPIGVGYIAFAILHRELPRLADGTITPFGLAGVAGAALYFPAGLAVGAGAVLVAVRRDWLDASVLLSPLPGMLVWVIGVHRSGGILSGGIPPASPILGAVYLCMAVAAVMFLRAPVRTLKVTTLVTSAVVLLAGSTLLLTPDPGLMTIAARSALLLAFLLSPALVARHA